MDAYISGQAALAIILNEGEASCLELDGNWPPRPIQHNSIPILLQDSTDVAKYVNADREQIERELELAWAKDRALRLAILILDGSEGVDIREDAADCIEELLSSESVLRFVRNIFYSSPLPDTSDVATALKILATKSMPVTTGFLELLLDHQKAIGDCCQAWESLPTQIFESLEYKNYIRQVMINESAFLNLSTNWEDVDTTLLKLHVNERIRGMRNSRIILQRWSEQLRGGFTFSNASFGRPPVEDQIYSHRDEQNDEKSSIRSRQKFENVIKQKDAIKALIDKCDLARAMDYTRQLVESQRRHSDAEHIAMSLCDLAQHAKDRFNFGLQLEFSLWAVAENPLDAWSHAQTGDAYKLLGDMEKALEHYEMAGRLGDRKIALTGKAEILKESGDIEGCLEAYELCGELFPNDIVPQNGRAAALAFFGRLDQALSVYDEILDNHPVDRTTRCGKAQVLRDMGRNKDALKILDNLNEHDQNDMYALNIKAGTLRELGETDEARKIYVALVRRVPYSPIARVGLAHTLKDLGKFAEATQLYQEISADFPFDTSGLMGLASLYKLRGEFGAAIIAYDSIISRFPKFLAARNGKAALLAAMGDFRDALNLLPTNEPSTLSEWISFHIHGMISLKQGKVPKAIEIFERGLQNSPWEQGRQFFRTALSLSYLRRHRIEEAESLIEHSLVIPPLRAAQDTIRLHLRASSGQMDVAKSFSKSIQLPTQENYSRLHEQIISVLASRGSTPDIRELFDIYSMECDLILLAA